MAASIFGINASASRPLMSAITVGRLPNQRPSGAHPFTRTGLPQPTTSYRRHSGALAGLTTIHEWTDSTPFQPPVWPDRMSTRASGCEAAGGRLPVLDQSASRQLRGPPSAA